MDNFKIFDFALVCNLCVGRRREVTSKTRINDQERRDVNAPTIIVHRRFPDHFSGIVNQLLTKLFR